MMGIIKVNIIVSILNNLNLVSFLHKSLLICFNILNMGLVNFSKILRMV